MEKVNPKSAAEREEEEKEEEQKGARLRQRSRGVRKHAALPHRLGKRDAPALGEPIAERTGIGSDRGACAQRALDRRERKKDERLDARTLARLARIDPQLTIEGPPFPHKRGPASCEAITY